MNLRTLGLATLVAVSGVASAAPPGPHAGPRPSVEDRTSRFEEREAELLRRIGAISPAHRDKLLALKASKPEVYRALMFRTSQALKHTRDDPAARTRFLETVDAFLELHQLAEGWDALNPAERRARRAELERLADALFELRQAERRAQLAGLQARLERLRAEIEERDARKDEIVDQFLDELVSDRPPRL